MKQLQIRGVTTLLFFLCVHWGYSQESYNTGSLEATDAGQNIIISATIGQVFASSKTANNIVELQGIQQPLRFEVLSIAPEAGNSETISLYPNPATTHFKLNFSNWNDDYSYSLMDINGKILQNGKILSNDAHLNIDQLAAGIYMVAVKNTTDFIRTFKLIKK